MEQILSAVLAGVVSFVAAWLLASRNKVSKTEFDKSLGEVARRLEKLETATAHYVTRDDLKEATADLRDNLRELLRAQEAKFDVALKALINEVRGHRGAG